MTVALLTRGMVCFGTGGVPVLIEDVDSTLTVEQGISPEIEGVDVLQPTTTGRVVSADYIPTITSVKVLKPKIE